MKIETLVVSPFEVNCYLVWDESDKIGVIIDPGDEAERILERIKELGVKPEAILLTHGHADHIAAVEPLMKELKLKLYIGEGDEEMLSSPSANVSALIGFQIICPAADVIVKGGETLKFGSLQFSVFHTPGHSKGGMCYFSGNSLFCGDTLFSGSIGRTDLPGGNYEQLIESIQQNILSLPDDIICYPGHMEATTVGRERSSNPFLTGHRFV